MEQTLAFQKHNKTYYNLFKNQLKSINISSDTYKKNLAYLIGEDKEKEKKMRSGCPSWWSPKGSSIP